MKTKTCTRCGIEKSTDEFNKCKANKDGLSFWCKGCFKKYNKKRNQSNRKQNSINCKQYRASHKKEEREYNKKYRDSHKEETAIYVKKYRNEYKGKIKKQRKIHRQTHRKEINEYKKEYEKRKRAKDLNYYILCNLRTRLNCVLKRNSKSASTTKLLGCAVVQLKVYLENQFLPGMTWKNHGNGWKGKKEWHIDHIKPCALFDLSKPSEQRKCFHYTNLQPLWAVDNIKKGYKFYE